MGNTSFTAKKTTLLEALESALATLEGLDIPQMCSLISKLPQFGDMESERLQRVIFQISASHFDISKKFDDLLCCLIPAETKILCVEELRSIGEQFALANSSIQEFRTHLVHLFEFASSSQVPVYVRIINMLQRKGVDQVRTLLTKVTQVQLLVEKLLVSEQYRAALQIAREKQLFQASLVEQEKAKQKSAEAESEILARQIELAQAETVRLSAVAQEQEAITKRDLAIEEEKEKGRKEAWKRDQIKKLEELPSDVLLRALHAHFQAISSTDFQTENVELLREVFETFQEVVCNTGVVPVTRDHLIPEYSQRVNTQEAMLEMWDKKIRKVENDKTLSEQQKQERIQLYRDLRDRDLDTLYE